MEVLAGRPIFGHDGAQPLFAFRACSFQNPYAVLP